MTDPNIATIIAAVGASVIALVGVVVGIIATARVESWKAKNIFIQESRKRILGDLVQSTDVLEFIETKTKRNRFRFWRKKRPDLSMVNLHGVDLRNAPLKSALLFRANLSDSDLRGADLSGADLTGANLMHSNLEGCDLRQATLCGAKLEHAKLVNTNLEGANLEGATLYQADLSLANLKKAILRSANLEGAQLNGTILVEAGLSYANLSSATLRQADLTRATLVGALLEKADLRYARLVKTCLFIADINHANFSYADLMGSQFDRANALETIFIAANMHRCTFDNTNLTNANLSNANLSGAILERLTLRSIDSQGFLVHSYQEETDVPHQSLSFAQLDGALFDKTHYDKNTIWPRGFVIPSQAVIFQGGPIWPFWNAQQLLGVNNYDDDIFADREMNEIWRVYSSASQIVQVEIGEYSLSRDYARRIFILSPVDNKNKYGSFEMPESSIRGDGESSPTSHMPSDMSKPTIFRRLSNLRHR